MTALPINVEELPISLGSWSAREGSRVRRMQELLDILKGHPDFERISKLTKGLAEFLDYYCGLPEADKMVVGKWQYYREQCGNEGFPPYEDARPMAELQGLVDTYLEYELSDD